MSDGAEHGMGLGSRSCGHILCNNGRQGLLQVRHRLVPWPGCGLCMFGMFGIF